MKKILLSLLFMSVVSMMTFTGDINGNQTNEFFLFGTGFPEGDGIRRLRDVPLNIRAYQTLGDFVDYLRNNNAPNGYPFVEGEVTHIAMNHGRNLPLDTQIEDLNIHDQDRFMVVYRCVQDQAAAQQAVVQPAVDEQEEVGSPVEEEDDDDSSSSYVDLAGDDEFDFESDDETGDDEQA